MIITQDCSCQYDLNEITRHYRKGLKVRKLKKGDEVDFIEVSDNGYVKVKFNGEDYWVRRGDVGM